MKWFLRIFLVLLALSVILFFSMDRIATSYVDENVRIFQKQVEGRYNFDYESLDVSILSKKVTLENFSLKTIVDSANHENKFDFTLEKLVLKFNTYREVVQKGQLHIVKVELRNADIEYGLRKDLKKDQVDDSSFAPEPEEEEREVVEDQNLFVSSIRLEEVDFIDAKAKIYHLDEPSKKLLKIERLDLIISEILVDLKASTVDDMLSGEELVFEMEEVTSDELEEHEVMIDFIGFRYTTKDLSLRGIHFRNKDEASIFAGKQSHRKPWFDMNIESIDVFANPWHVYNKGVIYLKHIDIVGADVTIYNDVTLDLKDEKQLLPPGQLRSIDFPFKVDSILIKDSKLVYLHKDKADTPGEFSLYNLHVQASNFTNIDYLIEQDDKARINVQARLWNKGKLRTHIAIDLFSPQDIVYASGSVRNMDLEMAERMVTPLYGVQIHSGHLDYLQYDLIMNDVIGKGRLRFDYDNLRVDIKKLEKEKNYDSDGKLKSSKFWNFFVNESIVTSNLSNSEYYKPEGVMIFDRTQNKPIFDLYWKSIQSGLMDIVISDALYQTEQNYYKKEQKAAKKKEKEGEEKESKKEEQESLNVYIRLFHDLRWFNSTNCSKQFKTIYYEFNEKQSPTDWTIGSRSRSKRHK